VRNQTANWFQLAKIWLTRISKQFHQSRVQLRHASPSKLAADSGAVLQKVEAFFLKEEAESGENS
jgi:hypothetical protein